jgi:GTPase SAR1 family protein
MLAVVIPGPPGAGKTSVLTALADALSDDNVPHAAVETEALRWGHPGLTDEQEMRHVKAVCALYREAGHALMLIRRRPLGEPGATRPTTPTPTPTLAAAHARGAHTRHPPGPATLRTQGPRRSPRGPRREPTGPG